MSPEPVIARGATGESVTATGRSFALREWRGSGPPQMHVHHEDDEAWHVLAGTLRFRFGDREVEAEAGTTVFVPAGVPHTYVSGGPETRYLLVLTPRLVDLIAELQSTPDRALHAEVYRRHASELVE